MTREEFMATTSIKSPEEAKQYLQQINNIQYLPLLLFFGGLVLYILFIDQDIFPIYFGIIFIIPSLFYLYKVQNLYSTIERLLHRNSNQDKKESIIPLLSFFKEGLNGLRIKKSLKIIIGTDYPPEEIEKFNSQYEIPTISSIKNDKTFWKYTSVILIISVIIFGAIIYFSIIGLL